MWKFHLEIPRKLQLQFLRKIWKVRKITRKFRGISVYFPLKIPRKIYGTSTKLSWNFIKFCEISAEFFKLSIFFSKIVNWSFRGITMELFLNFRTFSAEFPAENSEKYFFTTSWKFHENSSRKFRIFFSLIS